MSQYGMLKALIVISLVIPIVFANAGNAWAEKPAKETRTITGIVKKHDFTRDRVVSVYVSDRDEGEFLLVRSTEVGKALLKQVGARIKATGYVKKSHSEPDFEFVLDVLDYEVLVPPAPKKAK